MNHKFKLHYLSLIIFSVLISFASTIKAEARTEITIKNYLDQNIVVQIKQVKLNGEIEWVEIGSVSGKRARTFNNVTIGSVLRATNVGSGNPIKEFRVLPEKTAYRIE